jgi:predicted esterase
VRRPSALIAAGILAASMVAGLVTAHVAAARPVLVAASGAGVAAGKPLSGSHGGGAGLGPGLAARPAPANPPEVTPQYPQQGVPGTFSGVHLEGERGYVMHLPPAPVPVQRGRRPLVIVLHGLDNTWRSVETGGDWARYADAHGFLVAFGVGVRASWNAGTCCGGAQARHVNDVDYLVAVAQDAAARYPVDRSRIYLVGFSAGDMMAMRAECERPDIFAAAGGAAGALVTTCNGGRHQIRIKHVHGRYDTAVPYRGGRSGLLDLRFPATGHLPVQVSAGSSVRPAVSMSTLACAHAWPRLDNACRVDGTDLIWKWISQFRRPGAHETQPAR